MPLTLRTMLAMDVVASGQPDVLAGADLLDRPVRWVHVTEVSAVEEILGGQEVILTTGLPITGTPADAERFIEQLSHAGACGLIVELGPRLPHMPQAVIDAAKRWEVPLVALHSAVRFVSITEMVHRLIVGEQYAGLEFAQRTHEVFTGLSLDSADASTILHEAADLVGGPVVLEDAGHRVVALANHGQPSGTLLRSWEERSRLTPALDGPGATGPEGWLTCPVGLRGSTWGRLVAPDHTEDPTSTAVVMQRAAQALQLSRLVDRDATRLQNQAQASLLQELIEGRIQDEADGMARARALGMRPAPLYLPVVAAFESSGLTDQIARQRVARSQLETVSEALRAAGLSGIAGGLIDDQVGILLGLRSQQTEDKVLDALSRAVTDRSMTRSQQARPVLGVGRPTDSLVGAALRVRATVHIAVAARALGASSLPYFRSTDVRLRGLVAQLQDDERVLGFVESELAPLLAHQAQRGGDLMDLLRHYVEQHGNKSATAQAAHISRQALYGRLARLESILGVDLDDRESMLALGVALLVHDIRTPRTM